MSGVCAAAQIIGAVCMLAFTVMEAAGDGASGFYNQGNTLYREGRFEAAALQYQKAVSTGVRNADVHYNLGNAYYKAGELGLAVLNYERAHRLNPADSDIAANIAFVKAHLTDRFDEEIPNVVTRLVLGIYAALNPNMISIWVFVTFLGGCLGGGGVLFSPKYRLRWGVVIGGSLLLCGIGSTALAIKINDISRPDGIVLESESVGRSGPGPDFLQVFTLHEGTKIVLERQEGAWGLVRLPNGLGGWIPLTAVQII
jgi:tetratricopeptide (TPR) repeat protein